jgi:hypothetical protein
VGTAPSSVAEALTLVVVQLEQKIKELLSAAKNDSNEMFRICGRFVNLFHRPRIEARLSRACAQAMLTVR